MLVTEIVTLPHFSEMYLAEVRSLHPIYNCIRCGKPLSRSEAYYSRYDPDCEESMCRKCYERYEKSFESEE